MIRTTKQNGDTWQLTERGWPLALLGLIMVWVTIEELFEASAHQAELAKSHGRHIANVGGDAASGTASGSIALQFLMWPLLRKMTVDPARNLVTVVSRWAWKKSEVEVPLEEVRSIALVVSGMHAYAVLVQSNGHRVPFFSAFRRMFFVGGVPKRLAKAVEEFASGRNIEVFNEFENLNGDGFWTRWFGGA
ncbi:MAG: hypothetical protein KC502_17465 [Myxococcales bacterium]|nr:hypothetical protein [Myxococcales bacterium]